MGLLVAGLAMFEGLLDFLGHGGLAGLRLLLFLQAARELDHHAGHAAGAVLVLEKGNTPANISAAELLTQVGEGFKRLGDHAGQHEPDDLDDDRAEGEGTHIHDEHVLDRLMDEISNDLDNDLKQEIGFQTQHHRSDLASERCVPIQPIQHADLTFLTHLAGRRHVELRAHTVSPRAERRIPMAFHGCLLACAENNGLMPVLQGPVRTL